MRTILLAALVLAATLPGLARADIGHATCTSRTLTTGVLHVDLVNRPCAGAIVALTNATCVFTIDLHPVSGVHVLVLDGSGCKTGVVVQPIQPDGTAVLP